jgi:hypothetical protein
MDDVRHHAARRGVDLTDQQVKYALESIHAEPGSSRSSVCDRCGIPKQTVDCWHKRLDFHMWWRTFLVDSCGIDLVGVWQAMAEKARRGSERAAHMIGIRFDDDYVKRAKDVGEKPRTKGPHKSAQDDLQRQLRERADGDQLIGSQQVKRLSGPLAVPRTEHDLTEDGDVA